MPGLCYYLLKQGLVLTVVKSEVPYLSVLSKTFLYELIREFDNFFVE